MRSPLARGLWKQRTALDAAMRLKIEIGVRRADDVSVDDKSGRAVS